VKGAPALICAALLVASGCGGDGEDASTTGTTSTGGDPAADPDADYLSNADEAIHGTDPADPDSDDDTYLDGDEVLEGSDPLASASLIYQGGWPYQRMKDQIVDPGFVGPPTLGGVLPHLIAYDQFGELVDVYDFALHGRPIVIDLSAIWCEACKDLSRWLEGEPSNLDMSPEYAGIPARVSSGEIYWITVIFEDALGNAAGPEHAVAWAESFPNAKVTILADNDRALFDFLFPGSYPNLQVLDEDMTLRVYDRFDYKPALDSLLE
jgi:hypothetical protein